jgi:catechol 2,3-dioxygenase-like lactoylglutathione lyase family enzyme
MIQHVTREVSPESLEACLDFYALLGFTPVKTPDSLSGRAVWLQLGPTQLHLLLASAATPSVGHIAIVVDTYEPTVARLREQGHPVEPRREHWGAARSYVRDPAGQLVELMAGPPPSRT